MKESEERTSIVSKLRVEHLSKIFGENTEKALELVKAGESKENILQETGATVGVRGATFEVEEGEIFVIMGLSGSGKSTLVRMLNRLIEPTHGSVYIDGDDITAMDAQALQDVRRKKISMVFQNFGLFPHRTILENTEYGLEVQGIEKAQRQARAEKALDNAGLLAYKNQYPSQLSGGMQQRVGLARALTNDPEILLMDEAFSALDPLIRRDMQDELLEMQKTMNKTIIFITHDLNESLRLGDRIAIMKDGDVVQIGTGQEILANPANDYVKRFVEDIDRTKVYTAEHIMEEPLATTSHLSTPAEVRETMETEGIANILVVDHDEQLKGYVTLDDVTELHTRGATDISEAVQVGVPEVPADLPVEEIFDVIHTTETPVAVTDDDGVIEGVISRSNVISVLKRDEQTEDEMEVKADE